MSIYPYYSSGEDEYYLVENRRAEKWDQGLSSLNQGEWKTGDQKGGLVFWHIDNKVIKSYLSGNDVNDSAHRPGVMPLYLEDGYSTQLGFEDDIGRSVPFFDKYNWDKHKGKSNLGDEIDLIAYNGSSPTPEPVDSAPEDRGYSRAKIEPVSYSGSTMQFRFWDRWHSHEDEEYILEPAGYGYSGTKYYVCSGCGRELWRTIPALPLGEGAPKEYAHEVLSKFKKETDPTGSKFSKLKLRSVKQAKRSIRLAWNKAGAVKYVIYGSKCGKTRKLKRLKTTTSRAVTFKKIAGTRMNAKTYYKFVVVALNKNGRVTSISKMIHVATKGSKAKSNHTSVYVSKKIRTKAKKLKKGYKLALKAQAKKGKGCKVAKHVGLRYQSSNKKIVTVTSGGTIKGIKKGSAKVWVYAQNGKYTTVYVTAK